MTESYLIDGFLPTIGVECHVQLKTKTKLFAAVGNDARSAPPNSLVSHICLGLPGALPVLNKSAIQIACRAAHALGVKPQRFSKFDRKHYFYPDLPKGYQITQFDEPIIKGGFVTVPGSDGSPQKTFKITRAHLEEDAGKLTHPPGSNYSLVDLNRAGTPLLEIVSEPCLHSASEVKAFCHELYLLMRHADVTEGNLYFGNMRFDVNVSVSQDIDKLGTRSETKNLNSFKSIEKAVMYEISRQIKEIKSGNKVTQETRGWDDAKQKTFSQRSKEEAHDYRYFPEPDIPPVIIDTSFFNKAVEPKMVLPQEYREIFASLKLTPETGETIIENLKSSRFMHTIIDYPNITQEQVKRVANWLSGEVQALVSSGDNEWDTLVLDAGNFVSLCKLVDDGELSVTAAKQVLRNMVVSGEEPIAIAKEHDLLQVSETNELEAIIEKIFTDHPKAVADIKNGEDKAIGFIVGQVMRETKGKANPGMVQKIIREKVG